MEERGRPRGSKTVRIPSQKGGQRPFKVTGWLGKIHERRESRGPARGCPIAAVTPNVKTVFRLGLAKALYLSKQPIAIPLSRRTRRATADIRESREHAQAFWRSTASSPVQRRRARSFVASLPSHNVLNVGCRLTPRCAAQVICHTLSAGFRSSRVGVPGSRRGKRRPPCLLWLCRGGSVRGIGTSA